MPVCSDSEERATLTIRFSYLRLMACDAQERGLLVSISKKNILGIPARYTSPLLKLVGGMAANSKTMSDVETAVVCPMFLLELYGHCVKLRGHWSTALLPIPPTHGLGISSTSGCDNVLLIRPNSFAKRHCCLQSPPAQCMPWLTSVSWWLCKVG